MTTEEKLSEEMYDGFEIEEDEEETYTLDFKNNTAVVVEEEHLLIKETEEESIVKVVEPAIPAFQQEVMDTFFNKLTSRAIASLLSKHREVDEEVEKVIAGKRMGQLNNILDKEVMQVMSKRRQELRNCFAGPIVRYERVPDWAKGYVKDYINDMVTAIDLYLMESE